MRLARGSDDPIGTAVEHCCLEAHAIVRDRACQLSHLARSDSAATMRECSHMIVPVQLAAAAVLLMPHALGTARGKA
jgi:hypothetical protein